MPCICTSKTYNVWVNFSVNIFVIYVIEISPGNLDSSLCFIQPSISHDVLWIEKLNKQGDNIQPWHTPFPIWNQSVVPCSVLTVASWLPYRFLRRQVRWYGISTYIWINVHLTLKLPFFPPYPHLYPQPWSMDTKLYNKLFSMSTQVPMPIW